MLMYEKYVDLACENLGISTDKNKRAEQRGKRNKKGNKVLAESSYPLVSSKAKMSTAPASGSAIDEYLKNCKGVIL